MIGSLTSRAGRPLLFAAACLGSGLLACGGGGNGNASPTSPGPLLDTTPVSHDSLSGQVTGLFGSSEFSGSTVKLIGVGEDTVRGDNSFRIDEVPPGEHELAIHGPNHLKRQLMIEMQPGGANKIPDLDLAEDESFNLLAFDEIYREDGEIGTARMTTRPRFLIDQEDFDSLPGSRGDRLISEIKAAIRGPIAQAVAPFLDAAKMNTHATLKSYSGPCRLPAWEIHWHAERTLRNSDGELLLGNAWWCWWPDSGIVRGGILTLDDEADTGTILHELVHQLGTANHLVRAPGNSIIETPLSAPHLTLMDQQHLRFLYRRPPQLMTPDDASGLDTVDMTQLSGGGGELEMRCQIFADGTMRIERAPAGGLVR